MKKSRPSKHAKMENKESEKDSFQFENRIPLEELRTSVEKIKEELSKVIIGQKDFIELLLVSLLADGHVLIEGVPGVAKTMTAKLFAHTLKTGYSRVQFTPDLMPSDVLGTSVFNSKTTEFEFKPGPVFSNIVLIDEINRAPAKTQSALFEVMEERQVTIDGKVHKMTPPFMVVATQNPIDQEGTYALPEAQLDRFLFKIKVDYPDLNEEVRILQSHHERQNNSLWDTVNPVLDPAQLQLLRQQIKEIRIEENLLVYIAELVTRTRTHPHLFLGGSPRASIAIMNSSKAFAAMEGRDFVIPEDIRRVLVPVLGHRVMLSPEREMEGITSEKVIEMIAHSVEIPR